MDLNNEDLLSSAMTDASETQQVDTPAAEQQQDNGQPRDDQGRFAARQAEQQAIEQQQEPQSQQQREGFVPSGRLREERERADAAERRFQEAQASWQRQLQAIEARLPKQQAPTAPDIFENPTGAIDHGVRQAVDPIKSEIGQLREFYSQREAIREHGTEKVNAAKQALEQGMVARDPEAWAIYNRAMQSMDPYGDIINWHQQRTVFSQIGNDPQAWFGKTLDERLADPKFAAELLQKIQGTVQGQSQPQAQNQIQVPPNLRRSPGARAGNEESGDMSNASLIAASMR